MASVLCTDEFCDCEMAVMGGSSLTFAYASWTETLPDWIDAHVRGFDYYEPCG